MSLPVSFLSDYGLSDEFVGVVHGVMLRIDPELRIIDVTHAIPAGDVRAGALALVRAIQYLPPGVGLAVVDPGVGTAQHEIAVETAWGVLVGPDNGLLAPAVAMMGGGTRVISIQNPAVFIPAEGATFAGRDRMAPAVALLASGQAALSELGPELDTNTLTPLLLPLVEFVEGGVAGEVWWVDGFGNAQTNIAPADLTTLDLAPGDRVAVQIGSEAVELPWVRTYGEGERGRPLIHIDSYGLLAIAVRGGRASDSLQLADHTALLIKRAQPT